MKLNGNFAVEAFERQSLEFSAKYMPTSLLEQVTTLLKKERVNNNKNNNNKIVVNN